ncbi:MAG: anti-sigma factor [Gemmatimonadaceae bacterium]|nr:anti-sigma factor [Chitinophagaceae bacterium]
MNIKDYISSGIIESYTLGLASPEERKEFEQLCLQHPELEEARTAFEIILEEQAMANAVPAPAHLKQQIWNELKQPPAQVINMPREKNASAVPVVPRNWTRYMMAASVILLIGSTILNFYFYNRYTNTSERLTALLDDQQRLVKENNTMQTSLSMIKDPVMAHVSMKGQKIDTSALADIYWNTNTKDVYLLVKNLPVPSQDKQYQLWALVDGKPVDAGVFDMNDANSLVKMKNIPRAQAFAITLENKGGSPSPTMEAMYVMGQI